MDHSDQIHLFYQISVTCDYTNQMISLFKSKVMFMFGAEFVEWVLINEFIMFMIIWQLKFLFRGLVLTVLSSLCIFYLCLSSFISLSLIQLSHPLRTMDMDSQGKLTCFGVDTIPPLNLFF
jgi:CHASE2 domain-containing sensor protein